MDYTCFYFICVKCFWNETLGLTITRKGFSSQNKIETKYHIVLLFFFFTFTFLHFYIFFDIEDL